MSPEDGLENLLLSYMKARIVIIWVGAVVDDSVHVQVERIEGRKLHKEHKSVERTRKGTIL